VGTTDAIFVVDRCGGGLELKEGGCISALWICRELLVGFHGK